LNPQEFLFVYPALPRSPPSSRRPDLRTSSETAEARRARPRGQKTRAASRSRLPEMPKQMQPPFPLEIFECGCFFSKIPQNGLAIAHKMWYDA
jgi:hypothetical protein